MKQQRKIIHKGIDGELNKSETRILKKKILKDESARAEYEELKLVAEKSRQVKKVDVPQNFAERVVRRIREAGRPE